MTTEIKVPILGESVTEASIARWIKKAGAAVAADEPVVELETDKVTLEVPSPVAGVLSDVLVAEGQNVEVGALLGHVDETKTSSEPVSDQPVANSKDSEGSEDSKQISPALNSAPIDPKPETPADNMPLSPAVRRLLSEHGLSAEQIAPTGSGGRLTKADVLQAIEARTATPTAQKPLPSASPPPPQVVTRTSDAREERVPMSGLRKIIARRLKEAQNTAAILTTFNEVDMSAVMALRADYKQDFEKKHGAVIAALEEFPAVNAEIQGDDIIYKNFYNIGVAVGTPQGLVVPVLKDAQDMSMAEIETHIADFGHRARDGKLAPSDMAGGSFTISNGGVYGSMMSTPILNPPQSAILGLHKIIERPVAIKGEMMIRPMMYLALSYDHRIIDGREAVSFLVRIKQSIETPQRLLLDI